MNKALRPKFELSTKTPYDFSSIPANQAEHPDVYRYIDQHIDEHIEAISRWLRQPSISAENVGIREMSLLLRDDLSALEFQESELVLTSGHPGVWGYYDAGAPKTFMVYMMYDVQPIEPEGWLIPPFEASLVEHDLGTALVARGAKNQKGPERAFLNAVEAIIATEGKLPVNLLVVAEGEEELGSPNFPEIVRRYEERLRHAEGVIFPHNSQDANGRLSMFLGVKGLLYIELESVGGPGGGPTRSEIHGSFKALVDSPVWRLLHALASLTTSDGNTITVPGYYDPIRPLSEEEELLINHVLEIWDEGVMKGALGVERWVDDVEPQEAVLRMLCDTTLNIDGIWAGYTGPGTKTVLPGKATAKIDSRLVPNQRPQQAAELIRSHLDSLGFSDISMKVLAGYPPAQVSVETPIAQAWIGVYRKYGYQPEVSPRLVGSAPFYVFTEQLGLPIVPGGLGHGFRSHEPNEYMIIHPKEGSAIAGIAEIEKGYADLLYALGEV